MNVLINGIEYVPKLVVSPALPFHVLIKDARKLQGMTMREVSYSAGLAIGYVCNMEHGRCIPSIQAIRKLANALGVDFLHLIASIPNEE